MFKWDRPHIAYPLAIFAILGVVALTGQLRKTQQTDQNGKDSTPKPSVNDLLVEYAGSIPPEDAIRDFSKDPEALDRISQLLSLSPHKESWPGAVVALGTIAGLDSPSGIKAKENLFRFMISRAPFGCSFDCPALENDAAFLQWDRKARLEVPIALGLMVRNTKNPDKNTHAIYVLWLLGEIGMNRTQVDVCMSAVPDSSKRCYQELALNAVHGLEAMQNPAAAAKLLEISGKTVNALVSREAEISAQALQSEPSDSKKKNAGGR